ncbi:hypothetical protein [Polaribacter sp. Z022]|uniref:hypothetical protein n=1 Tax=Polaribacter sp. Z022 TaxID=2927125 RepID=UPI00202280E1|nr:hypothetical protein [Polaribacter sp. Z022]MCL7753304.1 hypothetical protein [Polaribacter sp. Z022]
MTTKEKIALATQNNKLYCFKEGMFCKVYNQNAMWFTQHIKRYKVNSKFVKAVNQQVFSLGFPYSLILKNGLSYQNKQLQKIEETQSFTAYKISNINQEKEFINWCTKIVALNSNIIKQNTKPSSSLTIQQELKNFDLANKTPLQAMEFIAKLKAYCLLPCKGLTQEQETKSKKHKSKKHKSKQ